jgi:hypothetical protein
VQVEFVDETDRFVDNEQLCRVDPAQLLGGLPPRLQAALAPGQPPGSAQYQPPSLLDTSSPFFAAGRAAKSFLPASVFRQATAPAAALLQQVGGQAEPRCSRG